MDYLQGTKTSNIIPAYASVEESALYVIENGEREFNNIIKTIGLKELAFTEATGTEVVTEASVKEIKEAIVKWLTTRYEDIKNLFNKALNWIQEKIANFKKNISTKELAILKKKAETIKEKDKEGKTKVYCKTYEYKNLDSVLDGNGKIWSAFQKYERDIHEALFNFKMAVGDDSSIEYNNMKEKLESANESLQKEIGNELGINYTLLSNNQSIISKLSEYIRGDEVDVTKDYIKNNLDDMFKFSAEFGAVQKRFKKLINDTKKSFNDDIKIAKQDRKDVPADVYNLYVRSIKVAKDTNTSILGSIINCAKQKISLDLKIIMKLSMATTVKEAADMEGESVLESTSYQTELVSLFNF